MQPMGAPVVRDGPLSGPGGGEKCAVEHESMVRKAPLGWSPYAFRGAFNVNFLIVDYFYLRIRYLMKITLFDDFDMRQNVDVQVLIEQI